MIQATQTQPLELRTLSERMMKVLRAFGDARKRHELAAEETLIFLTLGQLSLAPSGIGFANKPVTCSDISEVLNIPKETVRRKARRLVELELAAFTARGILMLNADAWRSLAETIVATGLN